MIRTDIHRPSAIDPADYEFVGVEYDRTDDDIGAAYMLAEEQRTIRAHMERTGGTYSRQHYKYPVAMTAGVFGLIRRAVENKRHCNDYRGVWHDVLYMSRTTPVKRWQTGCLFRVIITGTGRKRNHTLKIECGPGDDAEPVLTVMLPEED